MKHLILYTFFGFDVLLAHAVWVSSANALLLDCGNVNCMIVYNEIYFDNFLHVHPVTCDMKRMTSSVSKLLLPLCVCFLFVCFKDDQSNYFCFILMFFFLQLFHCDVLFLPLFHFDVLFLPLFRFDVFLPSIISF